MKKEDTVKLISAEGFEFVIHKEAAMVSQTIRNMLTSPGPLSSLHGQGFPMSNGLVAIRCRIGFIDLRLSNSMERLTTSYGLSYGGFAEAQHGEVTFPEISTTILEKICQYFHWSLQYASGKETEFPIEPELTLELMMAANYLHT
ncbi:Eloc [Linum perenne]